MPTEVWRLRDVDRRQLGQLLSRFSLRLQPCADDEPIPGSYWGDDEAGLQGNRLFARADTPLHSILHEASHYICMDQKRRQGLNTNAGSDDAEESAVCYLQILLADAVKKFGRERMFTDMDAWGYSFRLGNSRDWFENDADDALNWLISNNLVDSLQNSLFILRN